MLDRQTLISVIIPVFNVEKYLRACLDSVLAQTLADFELLLIDDGSPDGSGRICDEYAQRDPRVRVFHQKNAGQAAARNFGVTQAAAEWIAFVDSDDVVHPQYLELLYQGITVNNVQISICGYLKGDTLPGDFCAKTYDYDSEMRELTAEVYFYTNKEDKLLDDVVWKMIIAKKILEKYPFEIGRIHEDSAIVCYWLMEAKRIAFSTVPLYFYRENPSGTMLRSKYDVKHIDILWAYNQRIECYQNMGYDALVEHHGKWGLLACASYYQAYKSVIPNKDAAKRVKKEFLKMEQKCSSVADLTSDQREWITAMFHPYRFYFDVLKKKLQTEGIITVTKKCFQKVCKKLFRL